MLKGNIRKKVLIMFNRKFLLMIIFLLLLTACSTSSDGDTVTTQETAPVSETKTTASPYSVHGALHVTNGNLMDSNGNIYQLYGMSTHGIAWFPQYINLDTFKTLRDDWNTNCIRLAMYPYEYNGYSNGGDKDYLKGLIKNGIKYAYDLGMYVIVDWHVLNEKDPNIYKSDAIEFFEEISSEYKDYNNIIYEICNEPNNIVTWDDIKSYANDVIPVIRSNDANSVILVGTPCWSQEIDKAMNSPIDYENIMYSLHFYADTHRNDLRERLVDCKKKELPVFISEFGMCDASGDGNNNFMETNKWLDLISKYNISYMCWNLSNKDETCAVIKGDKLSDWTNEDLNESGKCIKQVFKKEVI